MTRRRMQCATAGIVAVCLSAAAAHAQPVLSDEQLMADAEAGEQRLSTDLEGIDLGPETPLPIFMPLADPDGVVRLYIRYGGGPTAAITDLDGVPLVSLGQRRTANRVTKRYQAGTSEIKRLQDQIDLLNARIDRLQSGRR